MANEFKIKKGLIVTGASGGTVVDIQGSLGQLFSVTDNLSGDIFAVSDISGVPIFTVNSSGLSTFDGLVSGITPVNAANFVTKAYVDGSGGGTGPFLPLAGGTMTGTIIQNGGNIDFSDGRSANFGNGDDLQIYHNGSDSYIKDAGAGDLRIVASRTRIYDADLSHLQAQFTDGGSVDLYYSGNKKFETTSTGVSVTGTNTDIAFNFGNTVPNNPLHTNWYGGYTGVGMSQTTAGIRLAGDGGANNLCDIGYYTSNTPSHANWNSALYVQKTNATFAGNANFVDNGKATFGNSADLEIYHNSANSYIETAVGSAGDFYIKSQGTNHDLYLEAADDIYIRPQSGESGIDVIGNAEVNLYYDSGLKLSTLSTSVGTATNLGGTLVDGWITTTQANAINNTTIATTAYVNNKIALIPAGLVFQGTWNAATNTPTLTSGSGTTGNFYIVSVAGSTNLDGITDWKVGDWAVFIEQGASDQWEKIDNSSVLDGIGTGNNISKWAGSGTSNTLTNSLLTDTGSLGYITSNSELFQLQGTTASGYAEIDIGNDLNDKLVIGSIGSTYSSADWAGSTYIYNSGTGKKMYIKSISDMQFFTGGYSVASNIKMTILGTNGNVGIGNTSPSAKLVVGAAVNSQATGIEVNAGASGGNVLSNGTADNWFPYSDNNNYYSASEHIFRSEVNANTRMTIKSSGYVGIGTTSPSQKLNVVNDNTATWTAKFTNNTNNVYLSVNDANNYGIYVSGETKNYFSGNVGIGTTSPTAKLHVIGTGLFTGLVSGITPTAAANFVTKAYVDGGGGAGSGFLPLSAGSSFPLTGDLYQTLGTIGVAQADGDYIAKIYELNADGFLSLYTGQPTPLEKVRISSYGNSWIDAGNNGNVGIGTTTPGYKLDVAEKIRMVAGLKITPTTSSLYNQDGALSYYSTSNGVYLNGAGASGWLRMQASGVENDVNSINIYGSASAYMTFRTANSTRMIINSSGNVGIGTTAPNNLLNLQRNVAGGDVAAYIQNFNGDVGSTDETASVKFAHGNDGVVGYVGGKLVCGKEGDFETSIANIKGNLQFYTASGTSLDSDVNNIERMRITGAGNVGIDVSAPDSYNSSAKKLVVGGSGDTGITISTSSTNMGTLMFADGTGGTAGYRGRVSYDHDGDYMRFDTSATERMRIANTLITYPTVTELRGDVTAKFAIANMGSASSQMMVSSRGFLTFNVSNTGSGLDATERMRITSQGNVGIGTESPENYTNQRSLTVVGTSIGRVDVQAASGGGGVMYGNSSQLKLNSNSGMNLGLESGTGGLIYFSTQGTQRMTILSGGNVGINNTSPAKKLEISSATSGDGILLTGDGTGGGMSTGSYRGIGFSYTDADTSYGSEIKFEIPDSAEHGGQISFWTDVTTGTGTLTRAMTIDRNQNVGIGTSTPLAKLDIQGTQGQLFSVTDNLSGSIFAVADISGVPIFDVNSSGVITFGSYNGSNQTGTPTYILGTDASGNVVKTLSGGGTGGGFWQSSGNNIYNNNSGNVGVGTAYPDKQFSQEIIYYDTGTASQSGTTVTGVGTTFTQEMEGKKLIYADGTTTYITNFTNTTTITVGNTGTVASQAFGIYTPGVYMGRQSTAGNPPQLSIGGSGSGHHNLIIKGDISNGPNSVPSLQIARTQTGVIPGANEGLILSSSGSSHVFQTSDTKQLSFAVYDSNAATSAIAMYISGVTTPLVVINNTLVLQTVPLQTSTATKVLTYDNSSVKYVTPATLLNDAGGPYLPVASPTFTGTLTGPTASFSSGLKVIGPGSYNTFRSGNDYTLGFLDSVGTTQWWIKAYTNGDFALHENGIGDQFNIEAGGNVGIGDTSPSNKLDVNGDIRATAYKLRGNVANPAGTAATIYDQQNVGLTLSAHNVSIRNYNGANMVESVRFTEGSTRITNKLGVGSTTTPVVPLDVTGIDTGSAFGDGIARFANTTSVSSGGATVINIRNNYLGGFGTLIKFFRTSTSSSIANISFNSGGTAVNYNTGSDYRLKEDLKTFNGLDIIDDISVYNYKWKGVDFRGYGVLAHELASVFPDAVTGEKDAEEMQSVDYSKLVPVLIKSVQELKKEIEELKQQLNK